MRILCLHGMGTSADIFEAQLGPIMSALEADGHELVFVDGTIECETDEDIRAFFPSPYLCYYNVPTKDLVAAAHEQVESIIDTEGPFDGVIGFSQGAALAASLMLERSKSASKGDLFSFGVFVSASLPFDLDNNHGLTAWLQARQNGASTLPGEFDGELGEEDPPGFPTDVYQLDQKANVLGRYHPARTRLRINVPTVHIIGETDPYRGQSVVLSQLSLASEAKVIYHGEGHCIPRDRNFQAKTIRTINTAIDRASLYRH